MSRNYFHRCLITFIKGLKPTPITKETGIWIVPQKSDFSLFLHMGIRGSKTQDKKNLCSLWSASKKNRMDGRKTFLFILANYHEHGLRTPFFTQIPHFWLGQINFGVSGVVMANLWAPILVQRVPCPCFLLINHYFYKKISLYNGQ